LKSAQIDMVRLGFNLCDPVDGGVVLVDALANGPDD